MSYLQRNNATIQKAFARLAKSEETIVRNGIVALAEAGLAYLIESHDSFGDMRHTNETDTLAYAVAHDGVVFKGEYLNGGDADMPGDALQTATKILSGTKGWCAIILSDMKGWYRVDWEMHFLHYSIAQIKQNFHSFFKRIK